MKPKPEKIPTPCPSKEQISQAVRILSEQRLHIYQVLHFAGLTMPNDPLIIERVVNSGSTTAGLKIYHKRVPELSFSVRMDTTDDELLEKAKMVLSGTGRKKVHTLACCGYAERQFCVCVAHFECPLHGSIHIGSHD